MKDLFIIRFISKNALKEEKMLIGFYALEL